MSGENTHMTNTDATTPAGETAASEPAIEPATKPAPQPAKPAQPAHIRIFISAHKPAAFPDCASLMPIQVGAEIAEQPLEGTLYDNVGENISELNPMYCELTAQYWAWKNANADYYGFCHYRRYFDFTDTPHHQNDYGEIDDTFIDERAAREYGFDDATIARAVTGWDVITSPVNDTKLIDGSVNMKEHWAGNRHLRLKDLRHTYDILVSRHPEYREDADQFLNGHTAAFCNMFIMRKEIFFAYCEWLFPILKEFVDTSDFTHADVETLRTPGHLSERLLNIWLAHQRRTGVGRDWKVKTLQCVHFTNPEPRMQLEPLSTNPRLTVPVVFAADDNYVPMLTTTIFSMLKNADPKRFYDVIVLHKDITRANQQLIREYFAQFPQATVRFYDVLPVVDGYNLTTSNAHISVETYYRFIIQDALPYYSKILYLDSDLIINGDVSGLYDTDLEGHALAAVRDIDFLGNLNMPDGERRRYSDRKLGLKDPYGYFQAGVLVMNLDRMRELHSVDEWLRIASDPDYIYNDQDILNQECAGDVKYLDYAWNVMHDCGGRVSGIFNFAPAAVYKAYMKSREAAKIVHYAGYDKPWRNPWCDFGPLYWHYAHSTPFSLQMMAILADVDKPEAPLHHERAIREDSPIRKYVDVVAPIGSKQRELMKVFARKIQGKK